MQVYKKSYDSYDYVFTLKSYQNLYKSKQCKERENEEIRRQKQKIHDKKD